MNELDRCVELSAVYRAKQQAEKSARRIRAAEEEKAYCEAQNKKAEEMISAAIQSIREGGILKNTTIVFYQSRYHSSSFNVFRLTGRVCTVPLDFRLLLHQCFTDRIHFARLVETVDPLASLFFTAVQLLWPVFGL